MPTSSRFTASLLRSPYLPSPLLTLLLLAASLTAITGCSTSFAPQVIPDSPTQTAVGSIQGNVYGGQQPIVGARVFLFAAATNGYGSAATSLLTATGNPAYPAAKDTVPTSPTYNDYYLTTDSLGAFNLTGGYTCTAGTQVYLYSVGGNPGAGTNTAAGLLAVLGQCPASGTLAGTVPYLFVNELSTVAAAYAMSSFATDAIHVGSSGTTLAKTGIGNAFLTAGNIYSYNTHNAALTTTPAGNGTVPQARINSIANSLAACINSASSSAFACTNLFAYTKSAGATGTTPTDTATAAINLAHNPYPTSAGVTAIYTNASPAPPFAPVLSSAPSDFTLSIAFTGSLSSPMQAAVDATGNVWVVNSGTSSLSKFTTLGAVSSGSPYTGGGLSSPTDLAIDSLGNVWVTNPNNSLSKFTGAGSPVSSSTGYTGGGLKTPGLLAIDSANNVFVANSDSVSKFTNAGVPVTSALGYQNTLVAPVGIAIDPSNNVWVTNTTYGTATEMSNTGGLILTIALTNYGVDYPAGIALDSSGNFWTSNYGNSTVSHKPSTSAYSGGGLSTPYDLVLDGNNNSWLTNGGGAGLSAFSSTGAVISPTARFQSTYLTNSATYLAIDGSGNIWVPATGGTTLVEFIGLAAPVVTPITVSALATKP